jgi:uncharacterized protein (TIGR03066 family)
MKTIALTLAAFVLVSLNARAEDKADKDKLLGKWEAVKGELPAGSTVEFTKDGKIKVSVKQEGKTEKHDGTYKLDGGTITVTHKRDGEESRRSFKVKKLTGEVLVVEGDKGTVEFKRAK